MAPRLVKYMGSKHALLSNGLGQLILEEAQHAGRIVDLFCGGSSVAWFAAENTTRPVLATDLQRYAAVLAKSVISRTETLDPFGIERVWFDAVRSLRENSEHWQSARVLERFQFSVARYVEASRSMCSSNAGTGPIWRSYGGHYFSPAQAATIDAMLEALPEEEPERTVCLAATISSGSHCAASPGHTAQPFQPTRGASRYIAEAWGKDPLEFASKALRQICEMRASVAGDAVVGEAVSIASTLSSSDLAIVDPPYSGVQYSRFYHVLEAIANGAQESVTGKGRYPSLTARPQSAFSKRSESKGALVNLLENLSQVGATVIFTFPAGESSNGLSGNLVSRVADRFFEVQQHLIITGRFSTLGGNNSNRAARSRFDELVLVMRSKRRTGEQDG